MRFPSRRPRLAALAAPLQWLWRLSCLCPLLAMLASPAVRPADTTELQLKAALIYKFAQFTNWPSLAGAEFKLCVLGEAAFAEELEKLRTKTLSRLPVSIGYPATAEAAKSCQVVYLNPEARSDLARWRAALNGLPILTVSDFPEAWQADAMIVFSVEPGGAKFKINLSAARAVGLSMSAQMLQLAQQVR